MTYYVTLISGKSQSVIRYGENNAYPGKTWDSRFKPSILGLS